MKEKIQKEFKLKIGTNDEKVTLENIDEMALLLEQIGNSSLKAKVHIFSKDDEEVMIE